MCRYVSADYFNAVATEVHNVDLGENSIARAVLLSTSAVFDGY